MSNCEIISASPKINNVVLFDLARDVNDTNELLQMAGFKFVVRIIANDEFDSSVS